MLKIERNNHCVIVYDEDEGRGIAFPNTVDEDVTLYVQKLQESAQVIKAGTILVPLLFDTRYKENCRAMQLFLKNNSIDSVLKKDKTAKELYAFYFANAIPEISPAGMSWVFCL